MNLDEAIGKCDALASPPGSAVHQIAGFLRELKERREFEAAEITQAAQKLKAYCRTHEDCEDCIFFKDYKEGLEVCELNRYRPYTWQFGKERGANG